MEVPRLEVSSTDLRARWVDGRPLDYLVTDEVLDVIARRGSTGSPTARRDRTMTANRTRRRRAAVGGVGRCRRRSAVAGVDRRDRDLRRRVARRLAGRARRRRRHRRVEVAQRLPWTPTALIGVQADDGTLAATVVAVLPPEGRGGTSSRSRRAPTPDRAPTRSCVRWRRCSRPRVGKPGGPRSKQATGLSFDVAEVVDQERFIQLINPLGDLPDPVPVRLHRRHHRDHIRGAAARCCRRRQRSGRSRRRTPIGPDWQLRPGAQRGLGRDR